MRWWRIALHQLPSLLVSLGAHAQTLAYERHELLARPSLARRVLPALHGRIEAGLADDTGGVLGRRPVGLVDPVQVLPEGVQPRQRMVLGQLDDHPCPGVFGELLHERRQCWRRCRTRCCRRRRRRRGRGRRCRGQAPSIVSWATPRASGLWANAASIPALSSSPTSSPAGGVRGRLAAPQPQPTSRTPPPSGSASRATRCEGASRSKCLVGEACEHSHVEAVWLSWRRGDDVLGDGPGGKALGPPLRRRPNGLARLLRGHGRSAMKASSNQGSQSCLAS